MVTDGVSIGGALTGGVSTGGALRIPAETEAIQRVKATRKKALTIAFLLIFFFTSLQFLFAIMHLNKIYHLLVERKNNRKQDSNKMLVSNLGIFLGLVLYYFGF